MGRGRSTPPLMQPCACASRDDAAFTSKPHLIARTRATSLSALLQVTSHRIGAAQSWPGLACFPAQE